MCCEGHLAGLLSRELEAGEGRAAFESEESHMRDLKVHLGEPWLGHNHRLWTLCGVETKVARRNKIQVSTSRDDVTCKSCLRAFRKPA